MKKLFSLLLAVLLLLTIKGCGSGSEPSSNGATSTSEKETVTLWTGGSENVKNTWIKLAEEFNTNSEYKDKYIFKVEHISSGTGATSLLDRLIAQYKANEENDIYDIVEVSSTEYVTYMQEAGKDIFMILDKSKIPNYSHMTAKMSQGEDQLVPYRGTTVVLAYDSEAIPNPPKTAEELYQWIRENPGKFAYNTPGSGGAGQSFMVTSVYNLMPEEAMTSSDEKWKEEWDKGFDLMKELHPYLYKSGGKVVYPHKNQGALDLLINKQIVMTPAWVDMIISQINQGTMPDTIKMTQLKPGFTGELANLAIPASSKKADAAHAVLDFVLSDAAQTILLDGMGAFPVVDMSGIDSKNAEMLSSFKIEDFRAAEIGSLRSELVQKWDEEIATLE